MMREASDMNVGQPTKIRYTTKKLLALMVYIVLCCLIFSKVDISINFLLIFP